MAQQLGSNLLLSEISVAIAKLSAEIFLITTFLQGTLARQARTGGGKESGSVEKYSWVSEEKVRTSTDELHARLCFPHTSAFAKERAQRDMTASLSTPSIFSLLWAFEVLISKGLAPAERAKTQDMEPGSLDVTSVRHRTHVRTRSASPQRGVTVPPNPHSQTLWCAPFLTERLRYLYFRGTRVLGLRVPAAAGGP